MHQTDMSYLSSRSARSRKYFQILCAILGYLLEVVHLYRVEVTEDTKIPNATIIKVVKQDHTCEHSPRVRLFDSALTALTGLTPIFSSASFFNMERLHQLLPSSKLARHFDRGASVDIWARLLGLLSTCLGICLFVFVYKIRSVISK